MNKKKYSSDFHRIHDKNKVVSVNRKNDSVCLPKKNSNVNYKETSKRHADQLMENIAQKKDYMCQRV